MNFLPTLSTLASFNLAELSFKEWIMIAVIAIVVILFVRRFIEKKQNPQKEEELYPITVDTSSSQIDEAKEDAQKNEPVYTGYVKLTNVSEQDAAVIMAITSKNTGIPLERLGFCSIKLKETELINIEEQDAAAVMAITANRTGIPLENLYFKSIKLLED